MYALCIVASFVLGSVATFDSIGGEFISYCHSDISGSFRYLCPPYLNPPSLGCITFVLVHFSSFSPRSSLYMVRVVFFLFLVYLLSSQVFGFVGPCCLRDSYDSGVRLVEPPRPMGFSAYGGSEELGNPGSVCVCV